MTTELVLPERVCTAFKIAFLLTGDTILAEDVVLEAVDSVPTDAIDSDQLITYVIVNCAASLLGGVTREEGQAMVGAAAPLSMPRPFIADRTGGWPELPVELQKVLQLTPILRLCFVLRVLLGRSLDECTELTQLQECAVMSHASRATRQLAEWATARENLSIIDRSLQKCAP